MSRPSPPPLPSLRLICIATAETAALDKDLLTFNVLDGDAVIAPLGMRSNQQGMVNCQFAPFTLQVPLSSDPATATLRIRSTLDANMPTSFYVDALTLSADCKPYRRYAGVADAYSFTASMSFVPARAGHRAAAE